MRILVTACPFYGHVNTVLPFAVAARDAGHDVVFATGADFGEQVTQQGPATWAVGPTAAAAGLPESLEFFWHTGYQRATDLMRLTDAWRPDVVVSEELELAGAVVAARHDAEFVVHGLGIAAAGDAHVALSAELDVFGERWGVPGLANLLTRAPYVSVCPPSLRPPAASDRVVYGVRHSVGQSAPGFAMPEALAALPSGRETVHLTLGTVFHRLRPGLLETAIDAIGELPVNLVVTAGGGVDRDRPVPTPPNVVIEDYLPHAALLPMCDVVVSHGGAGILLGALAHGLPQLVLPQAADQFANAEAVHRAGAGIALDPDHATGPAIADAVGRLLREKSYTAVAQEIRTEIGAMSTADEIVAAVLSPAARV